MFFDNPAEFAFLTVIHLRMNIEGYEQKAETLTSKIL